MPRKVIQPKTLSDPRPRYSQGILNSGGKLLFIAGQTASDKDGNVVGKGDIRAQTERFCEPQSRPQDGRRNPGQPGDDDDVYHRSGIAKATMKYAVGSIRDASTSTLVIVKGLASRTI